MAVKYRSCESVLLSEFKFVDLELPVHLTEAFGMEP